MYNLAELEMSLAGTVFASKLHFSPATDSTNSDALAAARSDAPHGSVYFADEQRAGRGRGDHTWDSAAGAGLYASVLLRTPIPAARLPLLPLAAGLAAAEAIRAVTGLIIDLRIRTVHLRHFARSGCGPKSFAAGFAPLPVKIAGVRDATDARSGGYDHDSRARRAGFDLDSWAAR